ncbi:GRAS family protein (plasmid) [Skermanella rosea]|uniref:GRAS family protein n=1 Tax=Skermanella rosea TaxID=1817965 RepID=UPI001934225A|nr:GRAS family protein [Skermanella rosea]UEM07856.1 GRAS family protein [Skermanella rosea]
MPDSLARDDRWTPPLSAGRVKPADVGENDVLPMLLGMARCIERSDEDGAFVAFVDLLDRIQSCGMDLRMKTQCFAQALLKNIDWKTGHGTLHGALFESHADRFPPMELAAGVAGTILEGLLERREDAVLVDVGIGNGGRVAGLLRSLAGRGTLPRSLTVVGIDPAEGALAEAEATLSSLASGLGLPFRFRAVPSRVESLTAAQWDGLRPIGSRIFVNAVFSLHHVGGNGTRDAVLRNLKSLKPEALVIAEPSADFESEDLLLRLAHAWRYYGACFSILDRMDISQEERTMARMFFGPEIVDVLGMPADLRGERFDTVPRWLSRLRDAGFRPHADLCRTAARPAEGILETTLGADHVGFGFEGQVMSAAICVR